MEYGNQFSVTKSFYDWCIENNRMDLNDRFDEEKNGCTTKEISYGSGKSVWFKCPRHLHESEKHTMCTVTRNVTTRIVCNKCNSVAQTIIDKFGEEYLWNHWHTSNTTSPWDLSCNDNRTKITIQCGAKDYHIYNQTPHMFCKGVGCTYCNGKKVHPNDSLAVVNPDVIQIWSEKNNKTPYEYTLKSNKSVWFKCANKKHDDYLRSLNNAFRSEYKCPKCVEDEKSERMRGKNNIFWRGGIHDQNDAMRHSREYKRWRTSVYERDNFTCQCCGARGVELNAHHINSFSSYPELRFNINNGITLCENCHDPRIDGSLHNVYGTYNVNPLQLRQYILDKFNKDICITNANLLYKIPLLSNEDFEF